MHLVDALVREGRYEELAEYVRLEFGVEVNADRLRRECAFHRVGLGDPRMWLKNRLGALGCFEPGMDATGVGRLTVVMHVFFVRVEETEEQLARLRGEGTTPSQQQKENRQVQGGLARSKVFTTPQIVHPVDRVASRVAPEPKPVPKEEDGLEEAPPSAVEIGTRVYGQGDREYGVVIGTRKRCRKAGCQAVCLEVLWPDGQRTRPCTRGMRFGKDGAWHIL